jgi:hypothetical protein
LVTTKVHNITKVVMGCKKIAMLNCWCIANSMLT